MTGDIDTQDFIAATLHGTMFPEEFVFPRTQFSTAANQQVELADAVVAIGDTLLICQIKERSSKNAGEEAAERSWFQSKVMKLATKQVRETLTYLRSGDEIIVPNQRGKLVNLSARRYLKVHCIVLYSGSPALPSDCRAIRKHVSSTAGLIHVVDAHDYVEIFRTLRVPAEVFQYFSYRERVLTDFPEASCSLPEAAIAGHFVGGNPDIPPTEQSAKSLHSLVQDHQEWDLGPLLRSLHLHEARPRSEDDYYEILEEFAKLRRSGWREVKKRVDLTIKAAKKGEWKSPYRIVCQETGCGFVFIPVPSELAENPDWPAGKFRLLYNYIEGHKHDAKLDKCVGYMVAKQGLAYEVLWGLVDYPWQPNPEIDAMLAKSNPFRPLKSDAVFGFRFDD